jgi:hypothetical protein
MAGKTSSTVGPMVGTLIVVTAMTVFTSEAYHDIRQGLYEPTLEYSGSDWGCDVFDPWRDRHQHILEALCEAGRPEMASQVLADTDGWALYAFSRLVDLLILPLQPCSTDPDRPHDWLPNQAYHQFITATGRPVADVRAFHPFLHEIVAVEPSADPAAPPQVVARWWPGLRVGSLLMMRAGVTVRAGTDHLDPAVATTSTMYWASRRRHRPACDLSHGWGSNSLWRTSFRRDYWLTDRLLYNVDAALRPKPEHPGGVPFNRDVELLRHRCSTSVDGGDDQWPWENHHEEPVPTDLLSA